jgi:preprotein translocase subunit SecA
MITALARKFLGTQNDRELKSIYPLVSRINELERTVQPLSDDDLRARTAQFKERISRGESLDSILPEAFATVREAGKRVLGQRHYDVQLVGGTVLHRGRIAEMRTGEGKTLVSTLPAYLNALSGKGVHVVTVNDYLAKRDAEWMGRVHRFLGLSVGVVVHGLNDRQRKEAYSCDITYGQNSEFGFDYLRDNMKFRWEDYVQRPLNYAIVDEVDSIFIDEARTPLIISGPTEDSTDKYYVIDRIIPKLKAIEHYTLEEKTKTASLTDEGVSLVEKALGVQNLYDPINIELVHHVIQALKAHVIFKKDVDYVVRDGEVLIVDEFTGRVMPGRRWSDGLHQAIEAKEGVQIENENQTLATITYQNYFRMYSKLSGMTGTADTEAAEFKKIYNLDVVIVPTNKPMIRKDHPDLVFKSAAAKYKAIAEEVKRAQAKGQPVLVGTVSVERSELLSSLLKQAGVKHNVLNAKHHAREAEIVAQAGRRGMVTIATNMAGRGTDILLGGNPEFLAKASLGSTLEGKSPEEQESLIHAEIVKFKDLCAKEREEVMGLGGLYIIGTERHESRRIDNQLRGRAGRQGDPGESRFYLSLEDDLMRIFGSVNVAKYMEDDVPIEHRWVTRAIENAQRKVEAHNFDIRKHLLEYDDVMNQQRKVIYGLRREILKGEGLQDILLNMVEDVAVGISQEFFPSKKSTGGSNGTSAWDPQGLNDAIHNALKIETRFNMDDLRNVASEEELAHKIIDAAEAAYKQKSERIGKEVMDEFVQMVLLSTIDLGWKDHLLAMDHLREGIGLRGYGQKDPLLEYKKEGFQYFENMYYQISNEAARRVFEIEIEREEQVSRMAPKAPQNMVMSHGELPPIAAEGLAADQPLPPGGFGTPSGRPSSSGARGTGSGSGRPVIATPSGAFIDTKVGRNDPCPCGSGKKYKKCHGV